MILYKNVFHILGMLFFLFSCLMTIPAIIDLCLSSDTAICFILSSLFCGFVGGLLFFSSKTEEQTFLNSREKILIVLFSWISLPIVCALPLMISSYPIPIINCIFETASALTTTGATVIFDIRSLSDGFLLWRSILQLAGSIGFIISCLHVFSNFRSLNTVENIVVFENINILYQIKIITVIYLSAIFVSSFLLVGTGLSAIDSLCYSMASISSGGMIPYNEYTFFEPFYLINWILAILMFISGVSVTFIRNVFYYGLSAVKNQQFICYASIIGFFVTILSVYIYKNSLTEIGFMDIIGKSFLIITSSVTTTGISINSHESFGNFIDSALYILNFFGGCSGSGTGGIKIFRLITVFLLIKSYLIRLIKTNAIYIPTYADRRLTEFDVTSFLSYFSCYLVLAILLSLSLSFSDLEFGKAFSAVITCLNNNGPFFGLYRATSIDLLALSSFAKSILIIAMVAGRVEFIVFFMVLIKPFWTK